MSTQVSVSTLAVASLYEQLAESLEGGELPEKIALRLEELELDGPGLRDVCDLYVKYGGIQSEMPVSNDGFLIGWILAGGHTSESSLGFESDLRMRVAEQFMSRDLDLPSTAQFVLHGWTLGLRVPSCPPTEAALLVCDVVGADVALAYQGLVAHMEILRRAAIDEELVLNAVLWRCAAIIEAVSIGHGLQASVEDANRRLRTVMNATRCADFEALAEDFVSLRNALTHLLDDGGGYSFASTRDQHTTVEAAALLAEAITALVFVHTGDRLAEAPAASADRTLAQIRDGLDWVRSY